MTTQDRGVLAGRVRHAANVLEAGGMGTVTVSDLREAAKALEGSPSPVFASGDALAEWLESLHECYADGSVGNRKWAVAQEAAKAARAAASPAGVPDGVREGTKGRFITDQGYVFHAEVADVLLRIIREGGEFLIIDRDEFMTESEYKLAAAPSAPEGDGGAW